MAAEKNSSLTTERDLNDRKLDSRDGRSINAPEVDTSVLAPQIVFGNAPEFFRSSYSALPHPVDAFSKEHLRGRENEEADQSYTVDSPQTVAKSRLSRRTLWILLLIVIIAIALGVGLGVGIPAHRLASGSPSGSGPNLPQPTHGALNGTSLAAISTTPNNNRYLLFQDINGTIRYAEFSQTLDAWSDDVKFVLTDRQPKLHTPLAVEATAGSPPAPYVNIVYVDTNDTLAMISYSLDATQKPASPSSLINDSFAVSTDSQSLALMRLHWHVNAPEQSMRSNQTQLWQEWLLIYSSPSNNITFLYGSTYIDSANSTTWEWQNISQPFYAQSNPKGWLSEPFYGGFGSSPNISGGFFFNPQFEWDSDTYPFTGLTISNLSSTANGSEVPNIVYLPGAAPPLANRPSAWATMTPYLRNQTGPLDAVFNSSSSIIDFDGDISVVDYGTLWIGNHSMPNMSFPFGQAAAAYQNDSEYIYHQFNGSVLLEETGDTMIGIGGFGKAKQISIPTQ